MKIAHKISVPFTLCLLLGLIYGTVQAISVSDVQPQTVNNQIENTLTITGADFVDGATVYVGDVALVTTYVSDTTLTATLPAGFTPGSYSVSAHNPDSSIASFSGLLTINAPPSHTATATETATPQPYMRPVIVISSYTTNPDRISAGVPFTLSIRVTNQGQLNANNLIVSFTTGDFMPLGTGGVLSVGELPAGDSQILSQSLVTSSTLAGADNGMLEIKLSYTDRNGNAFTEVFSLTLSFLRPTYIYVSPTATPTLTPTATPPGDRAQLIIRSYQTDIDVLQPGLKFNLQLMVENVGLLDAKGVTMVVGGATIVQGGDGSGTPGTGGFSATGGDFANFSPLGVSNVQSLGDLPKGGSLTASQSLIVNVTTNPGAFPFKISFVYYEKGQIQVNDQVITLLVYAPPLVEISFYQDPGLLFVGQPGLLPLQITNIGRKMAILGNMKVSAENAELMNSFILIGMLDSGGYYTLDTTITPAMPGPLEITVTIDYVDDFSMPQTILQTFALEVQESDMLAPQEGMEGSIGTPPEVAQPETFWQKLWRFVLGLLGLDSGVKQPETMPVFEGTSVPEAQPIKIIPAPVKGP